MLDALSVVLDHAVAECRLVDDLADVFEDKVIGLEVGVGPQAEALLLRLDDRDIGVLFPLEALVLAVVAAIAVPADAFDFGCPVDAVGILSARVILAIVCRGGEVLGVIALAGRVLWGATYANLPHSRNPAHHAPNSPCSSRHTGNHG